jgi:hypothetical protein
LLGPVDLGPDQGGRPYEAKGAQPLDLGIDWDATPHKQWQESKTLNLSHAWRQQRRREVKSYWTDSNYDVPR